MVAHAIRTKSNTRGPRPFDPTRDLYAVGRLLEEAFRPEHTFPLSNSPLLRELGILLWTMSYSPVFPEQLHGFVWVEDGQIVGNVTLSPEEGRLERYLVSNVAVKPEYRRRGIARSLMQVALDYIRERGGKWVLLNVRPNNAGAINLYRALGFDEIEMRGEWIRPPLDNIPPVPREQTVFKNRIFRGLSWRDHRSVAELLRAATPAASRQFRSPRLDVEQPTWTPDLFDTLSEFFVGQLTSRWVLEEAGRIIALLMVQTRYFSRRHRLALVVHPDKRNPIEDEFVNLGMEYLARAPRQPIVATATSSHPELIAALERHNFTFSHGLTLMAAELAEGVEDG